MTKQTKKTAPETVKADVYTRITDAFVTALEAATSPTEWPWVKAANAGNPVNVVTGRSYRGINRLMLGGAVAAGMSPWFGTFRQWQEKGAQVRKGSKGTLVVYWGELWVDAEGNRVEATAPGAQKIVYPKGSTVFSASQVDGWTAPIAAADAVKVEPIEEAERFVEATGAYVIEQGDSAFYRPATDTITMPARGLFRDTREASASVHFYSTLLHELMHWTAPKGRCDRDLSGRFGSEAYAAEELVAEIGAAFLAADLGLSPIPRADNVSYVASWLRVLKNDKRAIFTASAAAARASDFLHAFQPVAAEPEEIEPEAEAETFQRAA